MTSVTSKFWSRSVLILRLLDSIICLVLQLGLFHSQVGFLKYDLFIRNRIGKLVMTYKTGIFNIKRFVRIFFLLFLTKQCGLAIGELGSFY